MQSRRHGRGLGRVAALVLCCLLAADEDAAARRVHRAKTKSPPAEKSEFNRQACPLWTDPCCRHAARARRVDRSRRLGRRRSRRGPSRPFSASCRALTATAQRVAQQDGARYAASLRAAGRHLPQGARRRDARERSGAQILRGGISSRFASRSSTTRMDFSPAIMSRSSRARAFQTDDFKVPLYGRPRDLVHMGRRHRGDALSQ